MKKIVFVIPGFRHKPTNKPYREIARLLRKEGYSPVCVKVNWRQTTISENTEQFLRQYKKMTLDRTVRKKVYLLGFSYGAMIAFLASTKVKVNGLMLCSLSPFFKEDLGKKIVNARYKDFATLHFATLAQKIKAKRVVMMYGAKETKPLIKRVTAAYKQIPSESKFLLSIRKTEHDIADKKYLFAIHQATQQLL